MASIKSQMVLDDGVTRVLNKIVGALNLTLNSFEQVQRASGQAFDVDELNQARLSLVGASSELQNIADAYQNAALQEERLNRGLKVGDSAMDGILSKAKGLVTTLAAGASIHKLVDLSDQMTSTNARLSLMVDDGGSVTELERKIMASANNSRAAYLDTASAVASMGANAGSAFASNDELIAFMEQVNKQFVIGGATAQGQSAAMLQLTQAMAAGALRGEELNSILENAPGIARAIEQYMGVAEGSIKEYAQEGKVTAEVVKNALFSVAEETNAKFESMPMTWAQIWTSMQNKALSVLNPILQQINDIANSGQLATVIDAATQALIIVATVSGNILGFLTSIGAGIVDNWSVIEPFVWGAVAALGVYYGIMLALNAAQAVQTGLKAAATLQENIHAAALAMSTGATFAQTVAQYGLNAALLACPITWIVAGVIALFAGIIALVRGLNAFGAKSNSVFGTFMGVLNVVRRFVINVMLGIGSAVVALCSNIGAAFHNVIANVQGWFYNLLATALTVVEGICAALNKLPFVDFDYSGISAKADEYAAKSADAYGSTAEYASIGEAFSSVWADGWAADAYASGAAWGDGISDKIGNTFGLGNSTVDDYTGSNFALDQIASNTGNIAGDTGSIADSLTATDEELEYLRDIAERDAINRFTTAEVKIDMTGMTNKIDGSADIDGIITELTDGFTEALVTAAEGVHE